ncbi:MAG: Plug domain-containing protein, partial [Gemmatimonadetes bacterium]|nr:Plug domain-containing protein [Gemmatimonadota bacterium]
MTGTLSDSTAAEPFQQIVAEQRPPSEGWSWATYEWDRDTILRSNAMTLQDLLSELVPGFTALRTTWFGGPHYAIQGVLGAGFLSVCMDGRELTTLDAGQVDLTRIALASVESVRVRRRADGWVAEVTTLRRAERAAYSRITGGTGDPGLS